jgi:hypothetical protein
MRKRIAASLPTGKFTSSSGRNRKTPALSFRNAHHTVTVQAGVVIRPDTTRRAPGCQIRFAGRALIYAIASSNAGSGSTSRSMTRAFS